jgi:hypothetical protein
MLTASMISTMSAPALVELLRNGHAIDPEQLVGDYRGVSLGLPRALERVTWKTFRKSFFRGEGGRIEGHNVRMEQTGLTGPSVPATKNGAPIVFGPFVVTSLPADGGPFGCFQGVLLDYGAKHPTWHPLAGVRDPLVALEAGSADLLLGATYLAIGPLGLRTPSFFTLQREPAGRPD